MVHSLSVGKAHFYKAKLTKQRLHSRQGIDILHCQDFYNKIISNRISKHKTLRPHIYAAGVVFVYGYQVISSDRSSVDTLWCTILVYYRLLINTL